MEEVSMRCAMCRSICLGVRVVEDPLSRPTCFLGQQMNTCGLRKETGATAHKKPRARVRCKQRNKRSAWPSLSLPQLRSPWLPSVPPLHALQAICLPIDLQQPRIQSFPCTQRMNPASERRFLNSPFPALEAPTWPSYNDNNMSIKIGSNNYSASDAPPGSSFGSPSMGIILVVLLVTFFLMGFFSVYVRRFAFSINGDLPAVDQPPARQERGLDRSAIDRLPIVTYDVSAKRETGKGAEQQHEWQWRPDCVVCLTDFQDKETLRLLPKCEHCFHPECIDMWLFSHSTCPVCRRSLLPPPDRINKGSSNRGLVIPQDEARPDHELETVTHQHLNIENSPSQNVSSSLNPSSTRSQSTGCSLLVRLDIENSHFSSSLSPPLTRSQSTGSSRQVRLDMPPPLSPLPVASDNLENQHHAVQPFAP